VKNKYEFVSCVGKIVVTEDTVEEAIVARDKIIGQYFQTTAPRDWDLVVPKRVVIEDLVVPK
jgi:hypothetical protein